MIISFGKERNNIVNHVYVDQKGNQVGANINIDGRITEVLISRKTGRPLATYTLMHEEEEILRYYENLNNVEIMNPDKLPFGLRSLKLEISPMHFKEWLNNRIDSIGRTYMNRVYILRKVGRSRELILQDSSAISIILF